MPKDGSPAFVTINVRFPRALADQLDAYLALLLAQSPGANLKRSDVIRMGVEQITRPVAKSKKTASTK